jgi:16S rRNA G966 N2-methylase RsmD
MPAQAQWASKAISRGASHVTFVEQDRARWR